MTAFTAEPAAQHADVREALCALVGRYLADYEQAANRHALTLAEARVLGFAACQPLPQRRLAERFGCDPSNVSLIVDRLEQRGLVERRADPSDRRARLIVATEDGSHLAQLCARERTWLGPALAALEPSQLDTVREALTYLNA
jgi:DNA-binding MarR family transcriptional regulator